MLPGVAHAAAFQAVQAAQVAEAALDDVSMLPGAASVDLLACDAVRGPCLRQRTPVTGLVVALVGMHLAADQGTDAPCQVLHQRPQEPTVMGVGRRDQAGHRGCRSVPPSGGA